MQHADKTLLKVTKCIRNVQFTYKCTIYLQDKKNIQDIFNKFVRENIMFLKSVKKIIKIKGQIFTLKVEN